MVAARPVGAASGFSAPAPAPAPALGCVPATPTGVADSGSRRRTPILPRALCRVSVLGGEMPARASPIF